MSSSTKNPCRSSRRLSVAALLASCALCWPPGHAAPRPGKPGASSSYQVSFQAQAGWHVFDPADLATHRYSLAFDQKASLSPRWSLTGGVRTAADTAFTQNGRYSGAVVRDETYELTLRDLYLQYKDGPLLLRLGNQQVVWGEAFGAFYADIVNPKDLRRFVGSDLEAARIPVPMVNAKLIGATGSLQAFYIPHPFFNRIPNLGGDYLSLTSPVPGATLTLNDTRSPPFALSNGEIGLRVTQLVSDIDLSLFFLSYSDRQPNFTARVTSIAPPALSLDSTHNRLRTVGLTATADLSSVLLRLEALSTSGRSFDTLNGTTYSSAAASETIGVIEADYTGVADWRLGLQLALESVSPEPAGMLQPRNATLSLQGIRTLSSERALTGLLTFVPSDKSALLRVSYAHPLTSALEASAEADLYFGPPSSQLGSLHGASRLTFALKAFLGG